MYETHFALRERPFAAAPQAVAYFPGESHEHARQQVERCVSRAEGAAVMIGVAGTGKSLLLQLLADQFRDQFHVALLAGTAVGTRRGLLQNILFELGLPYRGLEEGELRLALIDHLQPSRECPRGMLLLIDEAHTLPLRLLEEIRLLTNLVREGLPRVRLVLAGATAFEERLASPKLESFQQRVAVRSYLQAFTAQETSHYVRAEIARCGGQADQLFSSDALRAVNLATAGIPRLVNQVCDHALTWAAAKSLPRIDAAVIQESWADLQQLPAPWTEQALPTVIEFGALDEAPQPEESQPSANAAVVFPAQIRNEAEDIPSDEQQHAWNRAGATIQINSPAKLPVDVLVPAAAELFGQGFSDEEIVIDRCAALDARLLNLPRVTTLEGAAFAREVATVVEPVRPTLKIANLAAASPSPKSVERKKSSGPLAVQVALARSKAKEPAPFDPALDPVYPEIATTPAVRSSKIVAIDDAEPALAGPHSAVSGGSSRFRNLFANLRGKK